MTNIRYAYKYLAWGVSFLGLAPPVPRETDPVLCGGEEARVQRIEKHWEEFQNAENYLPRGEKCNTCILDSKHALARSIAINEIQSFLSR